MQWTSNEAYVEIRMHRRAESANLSIFSSHWQHLKESLWFSGYVVLKLSILWILNGSNTNSDMKGIAYCLVKPQKVGWNPAVPFTPAHLSAIFKCRRLLFCCFQPINPRRGAFCGKTARCFSAKAVEETKTKIKGEFTHWAYVLILGWTAF